MRRRVSTGIGLTAALGAVLIVNMVPLSTVSPFWVLAFFICIYVTLAAVLFWLMLLIRKILTKVLAEGNLRRKLEASEEQRVYYYASFLALLPVIYLGMQSIGRVGPMELLLLVAFGILGCFYIAKR